MVKINLGDTVRLERIAAGYVFFMETFFREHLFHAQVAKDNISFVVQNRIIFYYANGMVDVRTLLPKIP